MPCVTLDGSLYTPAPILCSEGSKVSFAGSPMLCVSLCVHAV